MATVIVYWTASGNTENLAGLIGESIKAGGGKCDVLNVVNAKASEVATYDNILLGCPAMGAEELESDEFEPFYNELEPLIKNKKVGLFGSYDWGDGEWMRLWEQRAKDAGLNILKTLIVQQSENGVDECTIFGKSFI